jgi:hypothetical protein
MLQLATQSTQVPLNSRPVDNPGLPSSTCAVLHTPQKLFRACLAVTVAVRNLDDRQLRRVFGVSYMIVNEAGYMIVNELVLTRAGCGVNAHSVSLAELIHRALAARPVREGFSSRRDCAEKESTVTPRPLRSTRSLAMGKIIAVAAGQELMAL